MIVTWFGKGFDNPFLQTRLAEYGMKPLERIWHIDLCFYYRGWSGLKPRSSKLETVAEFWNLDERKDKLDVKYWSQAMAGHKPSLDRIVERCESDVRLTYEIYKKTMDRRLVSRIERYG